MQPPADRQNPDSTGRRHKNHTRPRLMIALSGIVWLGIGLFLLSLGSSFVIKGSQDPATFSLAGFLSRTIKDPGQIAVVLLGIGFFLGYMKGRFVLSKAAQKQVDRLLHLPHPVRLKQLYTRGYYGLILLMIGLGISLKYLPIGLDVRGVVDVAIGMALVSGALHFFRSAIMLPRSTSNSNTHSP